MSYTGCAITHIWFLGSIYIADHTYTTSGGSHGSTSTDGYRYFACSNPPSLYIVKGDQTWGPYPNRELAVGTYWGKVVCRSGTGPDPDPDPEANHQSDLGPGDCETRPNVGNPINVGLNNKYQEVVDIAATGGSPLAWSRYYNSGVVGNGEGSRASNPTLPGMAALGSRWRGTYDRSLSVVDGKDGKRIRLQRHTGERIDFVESAGRYQSAVDPRGLLAREGDGWVYRPAAGQDAERYDTNGHLVSIAAGTARHVTLRYTHALVEVTDLQGRKLTIAYDSAGRIATVSEGASVTVTYVYDETADTGVNADLASATYADGTSQRYIYNAQGYVEGGASIPHLLTGIVDETGELFATFWYDSKGRAVRSEHANGVDAVALLRGTDGSVAVTGPTKAVHRYRYAEVRGSRRLVGVDQPGGAGCGAANSTIEYNPDGTVLRRTGFDGRITEYKYDVNGNEIERTEAPGTPSARRTVTTWHPTMDLPARITWPGHEERFTYDAVGNLTAREAWGAVDPTQSGAALTLSRSWRMTYDTTGRLVLEEGPRSDTGRIGTLARHTYRATDASNCATGPCDYRKGDLWKSEDALGHAEEILAYDVAGRVRSRRDAQGTIVDYTYDKRGRTTEVEETRPNHVVATTTLTYTPRGDVASITDADGVTLRFDYDKAGRLIQVANPSNHRLRFELDAAGHRIGELAYDSMLLKIQIERTFDALGRVETETGANNAVTRYTYDEVGRPTGTTDADGRKATANYDALGRLRESIRDAGGLEASTTATYDPLDQLASIKDPKGLTTHYLTTGLGDVGAVDSPDSGESLDEHDVAGFLSRHEGAGGVGSYSVTRDALSRPTLVRYNDAKLDTRFTYDTPEAACSADERHGIGRLSSMTQSSSKTVFCYDAPGNIVRKIQTWGTTSKAVTYRYSPAGRLQEVAVDGGARTTYRYDADGSIAGVSAQPLGGANTDVITYVAYRPFDLIESWRYGNGSELTVTRDSSGRVTAWGGPDYQMYALGYTPGGEIASQAARAYAFDYGYDGLGHLKSVASSSSGNVLRSFEYNTTGDRTAMTVGGVKQTYLYDPASHHLTTADGKTRRYDAAGNTIAIGDATLVPDAAGRLGSVTEQGRSLVTYGYDAADQRILRTETAGAKTSLILYDEAGRWLADYDSTGKVTRQAVWMDNYLVGLVDNGKLLYIEPDHLGSPRAVIDPVRKATLWRWRPSDDPFGTGLPDEDPDADGARFVFDLRFPGQRYDAVTGLYYNYFRDYDAASGRYVQVDPIGLAGGINPYLYANGSPWMYTDPTGEVAFVPILIGAGVGAAFDYAVSKWKAYHCDCENETFIGRERSAALGAANTAFGRTADKPRSGIAGGGKAGSRTSPYSQWVHELGKAGSISKSQRRVLRDAGRGVAKRLPYVSAALAATDLIEAYNCE
ncbi:MAG TPA: RHS repeat-associated core domain-containing protein [Luteibacter sp.]|uniref:RHS repeat-associated core domain-containing protein n=1 Tax=Luteibacter sp. TaxID=1886636 RepID=UPI002CD9C2B2|nr:RHS repeat-associated core domain-containing protein [Luteibacter sp.]HVI55722.1 RHS repeat-associated core domain-containing protein [Luteibacter sp.]